MRTRAEIKQQAKDGFFANYWPTVGKALLFLLIIGALTWVGIGFIIIPVFIVSMTFMYLATFFADAENSAFGNSVNVGFNKFGRNLGSMLLYELLIFAWSLLFLIPGIIKAYAYAMTPYILADCPEVGALDAITLSRKMMKGHKWEFFVFQLSFIGWDLLNMLTCGVLGVFLVTPYEQVSYAGYYTELKKFSIETGVITSAEFAGAVKPGQATTTSDVYAESVVYETQTAEPVYAEPVYAEPVYAEPTYSEPVYAEPIASENSIEPSSVDAATPAAVSEEPIISIDPDDTGI